MEIFGYQLDAKASPTCHIMSSDLSQVAPFFAKRLKTLEVEGTTTPRPPEPSEKWSHPNSMGFSGLNQKVSSMTSL